MTHNDAPSHRVRNRTRQEITEAEETNQFEDQTDTEDNQTDIEHRHDPDICQLVQAEIAALGVATCAEIKSMIVHKII